MWGYVLRENLFLPWQSTPPFGANEKAFGTPPAFKNFKWTPAQSAAADDFLTAHVENFQHFLFKAAKRNKLRIIYLFQYS